ncbi:MAG TPA: YdcF family protein [Pseudomonadales bacterium]|nr:YdcF family protein [Pseudomonadales bacterium]
MDGFLMLRWLVKSLLTPPAPLWVLLLLGWLLRKRRPALAFCLFWPALLLQYALMTNVCGARLSAYLETVPPVTPAQLKAEGVQAIVLLGGGMDRVAKEFGQPSLNEDPLIRLRYAIYLARETGLPIMASGGGYENQRSEAELMQVEAKRDFGVDIKWVETRSRTTWENATLSTDLLRTEGISTIAIVTQAWHMKRSLWAYQQQPGFKVIGAATAYADSRWLSQGMQAYLPNLYAFYYNSLAIREIMSLWGYQLGGRD